MSSAVTEAATWETSVIGPDGTDLISAAGVRTGLQDLANRTKWLKEGLIESSFNDAGAFVVVGTAVVSVTGASVTLTDVKAGDLVIASYYVDAEINEVAGYTPTSGTYQQLVALLYGDGVAMDSYATARWGSTVPASVPAIASASCSETIAIAADAASYVVSLRVQALRASPTITLHGSISVVHLRAGQA